MKKLKVMTIVGTRPEIIRLSKVINELEASSAIEHVLVHTGQNYDYELNQVFFEDLSLRKPDHFLEAAMPSAIATIGQVLIEVEKVLIKEKPEAVLVLGDTNSCFGALAAKKMKIPVFHMEAGNRSFDMRVPEEINRRVVDHISDVNLCYSAISRDYLLSENLPADRVIKTGSPMREVLLHNLGKIDASDILSKLSLKKDNYFVISSHRAENVDSKEGITNFVSMLNNLAEEFNLPVVVSTHPRTKKRIEAEGLTSHENIQYLKPFGFFDYVNLQKNAKVVLSDSGTISEESSILNFPALNLRRSHERPEAMEEASVMMVGYNYERIRQGIEVLDSQSRDDKRDLYIPADYGIDNVAKKVVRVILSYVDYIHENVWHAR